MCDKSKKKVIICKELVKLCDCLILDFDYRITPIVELLNSALLNDNLKHLDFITTENLTRKTQVNSVLSEEENNEISQFVYSLGKSDLSAQKKLVLNFKEYIKNSMNEYSERYKRDSKLYVSFGLFFGIVFSLIWS